MSSETSPHPDAPDSEPPSESGILPPFMELDVNAFRRQESTLILFNLFALSTLMVVHWAFEVITELFSFRLVLILFGIRFAEQTAEYIWLMRRGGRLSLGQVRWYAYTSIWLNIAFAGLVSIAANAVDAHYSVLLILPLIAAGFRFSLPGVLGVVAVNSTLAFLEVWIYFYRHPPLDMEELFEAATFALVYIVVGLVVWLLARQMRRDAQTLRKAIRDLGHARDRLVAEEKLAAVGRLASSVAHEIRNPVGMIASALDTARRPETPPVVRQELSELAAREAARLEKVTTDFLTYAHVRPPQKKPVSVLTTVQYVADLARTKVPENSLKITVQCPVDFEAPIDAFQIHQALLNLLVNAIDHTPSGGEIIIGVFRSNAKACVFVENTGDAIPPGADIFEPFYTTREKGTGLGLPISRNIALGHGGDLILSHNQPGRVRFSLTLPEIA